MTCAVDDCDRAPYKSGLCAGHYRRKREGRPLTELRRAQGGPATPILPIDRLSEAALAYADADTDEDFARARNNLHDAAIWFALGIPKRASVHRFGYDLLAQLRMRAKEGPTPAQGSNVVPLPRPSPLRPSLLAS